MVVVVAAVDPVCQECNQCELNDDPFKSQVSSSVSLPIRVNFPILAGEEGRNCYKETQDPLE
jgi:hypothetical protein